MSIDKLINPQSAHASQTEIEPLTLRTVRDLHLPWLSKFNHENLARYVGDNPGKSLRVVGTNEYIVGEKWRGRDDIANIVEVAARRNKRALLEDWIARILQSGDVDTMLVSEDSWREEPRVYQELGFDLIEKIIFFERDLPSRLNWLAFLTEYGLPLLSFERATNTDLDVLLEVDHDSFPWLWWNCRDELGTYMAMRDVFVYLARLDGEPVGYASFTMYNGWAHLDRLAVIHRMQGRGYGASQLVHALGLMVEKGARNVGLSTQEHNTQSQRLYKRFGFSLGREAMGLYGRKVNAEKSERTT